MKRKAAAVSKKLSQKEKKVKREAKETQKFRQFLKQWKTKNPYKGNAKEHNAKYKKDVTAHLKKASYSPEFVKMFKP